MGQEDGEIWTGQALLQPISFKSDRLLGAGAATAVVTETGMAVAQQSVAAQPALRVKGPRCESARH